VQLKYAHISDSQESKVKSIAMHGEFDIERRGDSLPSIKVCAAAVMSRIIAAVAARFDKTLKTVANDVVKHIIKGEQVANAFNFHAIACKKNSCPA
jgi:hypothetical protein